jgi:hypothetical protein
LRRTKVGTKVGQGSLHIRDLAAGDNDVISPLSGEAAMTVLKAGSTVPWAQFQGSQGGLGPPETVFLQVKTNDQAILNQASGFDGMERVFALLPRETEKGLQWERVDLKYVYSNAERNFIADTHMLSLPRADADAAALNKYGVAFGMDTNVGTLWLQYPDHNHSVRGPNGR